MGGLHLLVAVRLLCVPAGDTAVLLLVFELPGAVLLGTDRLLAGGPVTGLADVDELVEAAAEELRAASAEA
jgi:hypothetical protein